MRVGGSVYGIKDHEGMARVVTHSNVVYQHLIQAHGPKGALDDVRDRLRRENYTRPICQEGPTDLRILTHHFDPEHPAQILCHLQGKHRREDRVETFCRRVGQRENERTRKVIKALEPRDFSMSK